MLTVRKRTDDLLVLGMSRWRELLLLVCFMVGLFAIGICLARATDADEIGVNPSIAVAWVVFTAASGFALFRHKKLIFYRGTGVLVHRSLFRRRRRFRIEEIDHVELYFVRTLCQDCNLALKDGSSFRIARGPVPEVIWLAQSIATFLRVPLDHRRTV